MKPELCENISVNGAGHLCFAGQDVTALGKRFGTPLYLMDEERIRFNCRQYREAFSRCFSPASGVLFASKACAFRQMYRIVQEEGLGADVVSRGEIYTAVSAGMDMSRVYFHGNSKTDADILYAMEQHVGYIVAENEEEVEALERLAAERGMKQAILLRLTPGIDPHTYEAISTGKVDTKFGTAIETGQAKELIAYTLKQPHVELAGYHCHVGSQVFGEDVFEQTVQVMLEFAAEIKAELGYSPAQLNLGGGYGVRYVDTDPFLSIPEKIASVAEVFHDCCSRLGLAEPAIFMEPGRSIVADAGMTVYTVGAVKRIPGYKSYVSVDGGMADNPRFALYGARYTCYAAGKMQEEAGERFTVAGCCCESGDLIQENVCLPESICRGDCLAVATTGAYNYSMASNYNRLPRPAVVMLKDGGAYVAVKRESLEDLTRLDQ